MHQSYLVYRNFRYLKVAVLGALAAAIVYGAHSPMDPPNGGTWLGYVLGTIGAVLILWLMWFGVRKRRYNRGPTKLQGWLSAHVYLGLALIVVATLHTGFQFGWNVHTLAYTLMMLVILSGVFGVFFYQRYPALMTQNRGGLTLTEIFTRIAALDTESREVSMGLPDEITRAVLDSGGNTRIGGSVWRQLSGRDPNCPTARALARIKQLATKVSVEDAVAVRKLLTLLSRKDDLVGRARRDVQYRAFLEIWLMFHVPLSVGLLAALTAHVFSVFFYW